MQLAVGMPQLVVHTPALETVTGTFPLPLKAAALRLPRVMLVLPFPLLQAGVGMSPHPHRVVVPLDIFLHLQKAAVAHPLTKGKVGTVHLLKTGMMKDTVLLLPKEAAVHPKGRKAPRRAHRK